MPTSPAEWEARAAELRRIYAEAEQIMLRKVARRLEEGIEDPGWAENKLAEVQALRREISSEIERLGRRAQREVAAATEQAYVGGAREAGRDLERAAAPTQPPQPVPLRRRMITIADAATRNLQSARLRILRATEDIYRSVIAEASAQTLAGTLTRREAAQMALSRFADQGISGFVDRSGRAWDLASYTEMATRSAVGQAAVQGHLDTIEEAGHDLVIVSVSPEPCPMCDPWEGQVLSLSGALVGETVEGADGTTFTVASTVEDARAAGLWHPNCTHSAQVFLRGFTPRPERQPKAQRSAQYEQRQKQRHMERQIRKWKRREAVAITDDERKAARAKVRAWQAQIREFFDEHDRKRLRYREHIGRAR